MPKTVESTGWEQSQIDKKISKKYPHMMEESWAKKLKKGVRKRLAKKRSTQGYKLGKSGMSKKQASSVETSHGGTYFSN